MKITGKLKAEGILLGLVLTVFFIFTFLSVSAEPFSSETITTTFPEVEPTILETIERFYEISERSLKIGYAVDVKTDSAFRTTIGQTERYIVVNNFTEESINLMFLGSGKTLFNRKLDIGDYVIFKIKDLNFQFTLHSVNKSFANVELELFEEEIPEDVDYYELFDIQVRLDDHTIYSPQDLSAIIEFTNFGNGTSHVRLVYSIIDVETGKEYYTGIDEKIVETTEIMRKNFYTLDIPYGKYIIKTTIYYGDNQEATSEESFTYTTIPKSQVLRQPAIFITAILIGFAFVMFFKKKIKNSKKLF